MNEAQRKAASESRATFSRQVDERVARKLRAQRQVTRIVWSGLGMMGLVGWSVAVPTLLGAALGFWLDRHYPGSHSWTLMLLSIGLGLGCFNAWHWVAREGRKIREQEENDLE
jgi:ATP synthase protein I